MPGTKPKTLGHLLYWSYANLAMMGKAVEDGAERPNRIHFSIRAKLYAGLCKGTMQVRGYFDDEKLKLKLPQVCWYCGGAERLSADHIIPQARGGPDSGENLIYCCRSCNSSKGSADLLAWMARRGRFPTLYLLRRYLKLSINYCQSQGLMDMPLEDVANLADRLPFDPEHIPLNYPPPPTLCKFVTPIASNPPAPGDG